MVRFCLVLSVFALVLRLLPTTAVAQAVPTRAPTARIEVQTLPQMEKPAPPFDAEKATRAYLSRVSGKARERSDAYF